MIHILGLESHFFQFVGVNTREPASQLRAFVEDFLDENDVGLIAEELTEDYCGIGCEEVVCESIADDRDIEHRFVEPNDQEREELGIASENHAAREAH